MNDRFESLRGDLGTLYFKDSLFRPVKEKKEIVYGKNNLQIGRRMDGSVFTLDLSEACRITGVGANRCLPMGTLVKTKNGLVKIEEAKKVLSYNFEKKIIEEKKCTVHNKSMRKIFIIKTKNGYIKCSPEHKFPVRRENNIVLVMAKDLKKTDKLLVVIKQLTDIEILDLEEKDEEIMMVDLEVEDNKNFILENNIITSNSGKTFFLGSIADRLVNVGNSLIFISDVKNEFCLRSKPVQKKFQHLLLEGETPKGMKVASLRPTFFRTIDKEKPLHSFWYSIDFRSLSKSEFMTLLNSEELTQNQRVALEIVYQRLTEELKKNPNLSFSVDLMNTIIDSIDELSSMQKNSLKFKFMPLEQAKFFVDRYERSIVDLILDGFVPAINFENFDRFSKGGYNFPEVVMSIVLREVIQARRDKIIKPLWIMMDEASRFIGERRSNSLKDLVLESFDLDSRYGVNWFVLSQNLDDVPTNILRQSKYILVPATADTTTIRLSLLSTGLVKNQQIAQNESMRLKRMMIKVPYSWIVLNRMSGSIDFIRPLAPLSWHMETSK